jgi:carbamoyltransferase
MNKDIKILGISGGPNMSDWNVCNMITPYNFHDSSAALIINGNVVSAIEEERITRIKHTNLFPINAIKYCLESQDLSLKDIDFFTFSIEEIFLDNMLVKLGYDLKGRKFIQLLLSDIFDFEIDVSKLKFYNHHYAHAASAFYQSGFSESLVLTLDGIGDGISGTVYKGNKNGLELLRTIEWNDSLGHFYNHFTKFLGFKFFDEYKVMGLASYGDSNKFQEIFKTFYELLPNGNYLIKKDAFKTLESYCKPRMVADKIESIHFDIAASLQKTLEEIVLHISSYFQKEYELDYLSLAGGVALNSKLAGELIYSNLFKDIFIHPASADNGLPIGSALAHYFKLNNNKKGSVTRLTNVYWGESYRNRIEIKSELALWKDYIYFEEFDDITDKTAEYLAQEKVIGWIQGKSEFGPRALGNRSILADPRPIENKEKVNAIIKMREGFRPFAPSVLQEEVQEYFEIPKNKKKDYPFMSFVLRVKEEHKNSILAVTHVDGTARVQTVSKKANLKYWELIQKFKNLTGIPILLNTSFNNHIEPIVDSHKDAINCFLTNKLDALVIDDFFITKKKDISKYGEIFSLYLSENVKIIENNYLEDSYWKTKLIMK